MTFYVNGIQGGNSRLGTVDSTGLYTAPAIVPVPNSVTVTAVLGRPPNLSQRNRSRQRSQSHSHHQRGDAFHIP